MSSETSIQLTAADGTQLHGNHFHTEQPKARIVVASATGVPQRFYRQFALDANANQIDVLTFDYRGIGLSAPDSLKGYKMDYRDWAEQDLAAAVQWANHDGLPVFVVGHSYGGHAVGLLPDPSLIQGAYVFGTGSGWSGWMPRLERLRVNLMWHVFAPILVRMTGFLAWSKLGMGEDLPKDVYRQWKQWCQFPHYFFDDPSMAGIDRIYARYDKDLIAVNATDDKWAQPRSRDAFVKGYKNANLTCVDVEPSEYQMREIDHMGYFRKQASGLWIPIFEWINSKIA